MCKNFLKRLYVNGDVFSFRTLLFGVLILSVCRAQNPNRFSSRGGNVIVPNRNSKRENQYRHCTVPRVNNVQSFALRGCQSNCALQPGTTLPDPSVVDVSCYPGYAVDNSGSDSLNAACANAVWSPRILDCKKICKRLSYSDSVEFVCFQHRNGPRVDCKSAVLLEGYIVKMKCKRFYHENNKVPYDEIICMSNGEWSNPPLKCYPDCGQPYGHPTELISHAQAAKYGDSPWHAVVYDRKDYKIPTIICGGTIISPTLIVSAAHCFYDEEKEKPFAVENYEIVVNKVSSDYNSSDLNRAGRYEIQKMIFNPEVKYYGSHSNYESDIVILRLREKIKISSHVLPACVNLKESGTFGLGEYRGKISGFGLDENGELSKVLKTVTLPYISRNDCLQKVNPDFRSSIALDKFCAGTNSPNDPGAQKGDSGGGFLYRDPQSTLYYLRGVVSIKDKSSDASLTVFTDITSHIKWIGDVMNQEQNAQNFVPTTEHEAFTTIATFIDTTEEGRRKPASTDSNDADNDQDRNRLDWPENQGLFRGSTTEYPDLDFSKTPPTRSPTKSNPDPSNSRNRPPMTQTPPNTNANADSLSNWSPNAQPQCTCVAKTQCSVFVPQQINCGEGQICCPQSNIQPPPMNIQPPPMNIQSPPMNAPAVRPPSSMQPSNSGGFMQWYTVSGANGPQTCICTIIAQCSNPLQSSPFNLDCGDGKVCCLQSGSAASGSQQMPNSNSVQTQWFSTANSAPVNCICMSRNQCGALVDPNIRQIFNCGEGQVCCPQVTNSDSSRSNAAINVRPNLQAPSWSNNPQVQWYTVSGTNGATTCLCTVADQCSNPLDGGVFNLNCGVGRVCCVQSPEVAKQLTSRSSGSNAYQPSNTGVASYQYHTVPNGPANNIYPSGPTNNIYPSSPTNNIYPSGPTHNIYSSGANFIPSNTLPHGPFIPSNSHPFHTVYK